MNNNSNWTQVSAEYQNTVISALNDLAAVAQDQEVANAYRAAANELFLWVEGSVGGSPVSAWIDVHQEDLKPYAGKTVAIHLEKGVIASGEATSFWDGSFANSLAEEFQNNSSVFITTVSG